MITAIVPWSDVFPWAQILGGDGQLWSVLPTHPMFPRHITRPGMPVWVLSARPTDPATIYVPTETEAINNLRTAFGLELLGIEPAPGAPWRCPAVVTHWQLSRHLRDFHAAPIASLGNLSEYDTHRWHNGLHQQVSIWPLPVSHIHTREVTNG